MRARDFANANLHVGPIIHAKRREVTAQGCAQRMPISIETNNVPLWLQGSVYLQLDEESNVRSIDRILDRFSMIIGPAQPKAKGRIFH